MGSRDEKSWRVDTLKNIKVEYLHANGIWLRKSMKVVGKVLYEKKHVICSTFILLGDLNVWRWA